MAFTTSGFSTIGRHRKFKLNNFELAKMDLYNHLHIKRGEKLMDPNFGTIIWGLLFEPLDNQTLTAIQDDINKILAYDPRLQANNVNITQQEHGIQLSIELTYIPDNQTDVLIFNFDNARK
jgi:phage baseplate assembly protein W